MKSDKMPFEYKEARTLKYFFHRQIWSLFAVLILVPITWSFAIPVMGEGSWMGITDITWFWFAVGVPIVHQVVVWIVFRGQLGWGFLTKLFGKYDLLVWAIVFLPFLIARVIIILGLARSSSNTLALPQNIAFSIGFILAIPAIYTLWSVFRYFGLIRALGADHFRLSYRKMPLVKEGIFRFSSNSMYSFAFLLLWSIALFQGSQPALIVAIFQHAYIWVHYFCTEKPDMEIIYPD